VIVMFKRGPLAWMPLTPEMARAFAWGSRAERIEIGIAVYLGVILAGWLDWAIMSTLLRAAWRSRA
jgi:hypothetical protein